MSDTPSYLQVCSVHTEGKGLYQACLAGVGTLGPSENSACCTQHALLLLNGFAYTVLSFYYTHFSIINLESFWIAIQSNFNWYLSIKPSREISFFFLYALIFFLYMQHFLSLSQLPTFLLSQLNCNIFKDVNYFLLVFASPIPGMY